jgi:hypothetical protein
MAAPAVRLVLRKLRRFSMMVPNVAQDKQICFCGVLFRASCREGSPAQRAVLLISLRFIERVIADLLIEVMFVKRSDSPEAINCRGACGGVTFFRALAWNG